MLAARCAATVTFALGVALCLPESTAVAADPKPTTTVSGNVVKLDAGDVVIDIGTKGGALDGDVLELWRPLKIKHPVTGKILVDRFRIGSVRVTQAGEVMSLAAPVGTPLRPIEAGDVVILPHGPPMGMIASSTGGTTTTTAPTPMPKSSSTVPAPTVVDEDPDARSLGAMFDELSGASVETRVARYEAWAREHSTSRFVTVLLEETQALRRLLMGKTAGESIEAPPVAISFKRPEETLGGAPLTIGIELAGPAVGAVLHLRHEDEPAFTSIPMRSAGNGYYDVTLEKERMRAPLIAYFIEAVLPNGSSVPVVGSATDALITKVNEPPKPAPPPPHESTMALWTDYADYNRLRGNDYAWQTEGWFSMRFGDVGLRAVRSGFGVYKGQGGGLVDLDELHLSARTVGLTYGYVEGEWGLNSSWSIITRAIVGLGDSGVTGGGQAFVRIGSDKKTNLLIGGEFLGGVGVRGITQVELNMFPRFPILLRSEVTNQPAGSAPTGDRLKELKSLNTSADTGDLGVRAILQAGYRVNSNLTFFLRGSYQGRTINHAGPGFGAGVTFTW